MTIVRSDKDIVSAAVPIRNAYHRTLGKILHPGKSRNALRNREKDIVIKNDSYFDVVNNHDMAILDKLDENQVIGKGIKLKKKTNNNNNWINHVKLIQNKKGISYKEALVEASKTYKK
jgi:UDP-N-acetylglucosamine transferase subunit ALG13